MSGNDLRYGARSQAYTRWRVPESKKGKIQKMSGCGIRMKSFTGRENSLRRKRVWGRTRSKLAVASAKSWGFPEWCKNFMGR